MTVTEEIVNSVLDRNIEATNLGNLASFCELMAAKPDVGLERQCRYALEAERFRLAQWDEILLSSHVKKCRIAGCNTRVGGTDICPRCEEEINGTPYPLASILKDAPASYIAYPTLCAIIASMIALIWMIFR